MYGSFAQKYGAVGVDPQGFAIFPDATSGFVATDALVGHYAQKGFSITDLVNTWSPPNAPGNSDAINRNYVSTIAKRSGLDPNQPIASQSAGSFLDSLNPLNWLNPFSSDPFGYGKDSSGKGASLSRTAAFVLGLILIAGGIYLFKPVQEIVQTTARKAGEIAAIAG